MLRREVFFLSLLCGLITVATQEFTSLPSFEVRACGEDGEITSSVENKEVCRTKTSHLNVLDWKSAKIVCQLRGGKLAANETINQILKSEVPSMSMWSNSKGCHVWKISLDGQKMFKKRSCESRFPVMCEWELWTAPGKCPERYRRSGRKCYRVFDDFLHSIDAPVTKKEALEKSEKKCKEDGGWLASLTTEMDYSSIMSSIKGYSRVNILGKLKNKTFIILGDSEVRPGMPVPFEKVSSPLGFVCEKEMKKTYGDREKTNQAIKPCGGGFEAFDEKHDLCFLKPGFSEGWKNAKNYCEKKGASLASIHSHYDNAIVHLVRLQFKDDIWIGLKGSDSKWSDGTKVVFNNIQDDGTSSNCGVMNEDGKWSASVCNVEKQFSCFMRKQSDKLVLPMSCGDAKDDIKIKDICYSKTKCVNKAKWRSPNFKSKDQVTFLLDWALKSEEQCLKLSNRTHFENIASSKLEDLRMPYMDYQGFRKARSSCTGGTVNICEEAGPKSSFASKPTSPSPSPPNTKGSETNDAILIISILSSLLGATIVIFVVGITVYCLVFRPKASESRKTMEELKQQPQPMLPPRPATVGNAPSRTVPVYVPTIPTVPKNPPVEEEDILNEDIYEAMDEME